MFTQYLMQRGVEQMSRGVVAHDVVTAGDVHFSNGFVSNFWLSRNDFTNMDNDTGRGFAHVSNFDLPLPFALTRSSPRGRGKCTDITRVAHLSTRCDVEACLGKDDFYLITKGNGFNCLAIRN